MKLITQEALKPYEAKLIAYRRHLHQYPELSFEEFETSQFIAKEMSKLQHAEILPLTKTSLLVKFRSGKPGPKIGLRADIDALPIHEERIDCDFISKNPGKMHACGHDAHTAILMAACHYFNDHFEELTGEVWAVFQHAEELLPGGAREIVALGVLDELDFMYGHHLWSMLPTGVIDLKIGAVTANTDIYKAKIIGKGGHSSEPQNCIDPVLIASQIVCRLQSIVSRQLAPLEAGVISNTYIRAGNPLGLNVIPEYAEIGGSVRSTTPETRALFKQQIERIITSSCADFDASCEIDYTIGYGITKNDADKTEVVKKIAEMIGEAKVIADPPYLCGEDFSAYSDILPTTFAFIGAGNQEKGYIYPHHHPQFGLDEDSFIYGLQMFINVVYNFSDENSKLKI